jgi:hypothetical protein
VAALRQAGVEVVMLTGDNEATARRVAGELGIPTVVAEVLPADKASRVAELQHGGRRVAMVGDGVSVRLPAEGHGDRCVRSRARPGSLRGPRRGDRVVLLGQSRGHLAHGDHALLVVDCDRPGGYVDLDDLDPRDRFQRAPDRALAVLAGDVRHLQNGSCHDVLDLLV